MRLQNCFSAVIVIVFSSILPAIQADDEAVKSASAISKFKSVLEKSNPAEISFAIPDSISKTPLTKADAELARELAWSSFANRMKPELQAELKSGELKIGGKAMPFTYKTFGERPRKGHSLWISMHGGGGAPKAVNDRQWENQKRLYKLEEGIYLVPRAPTDTWDLWHQGHIDTMFTRLIQDMIIVEGVDPNRVYIMGYSAGGDGVFQLAPRMADQLAGAAMMAGHPNETQPLGLRNLPFALQMGGNDTAYNRNKIAREWAVKLADLQKNDTKGYTHFVKIYEGKGHWMDGEDKVAIPWLQKFSRELNPDRVAWRQDDVIHNRFYWLSIDSKQSKAGQELVVSRNGQEFEVEKAEGIDQFQLILNDRQVDLDKPVRVKFQGKIVAEDKLPRTLHEIWESLKQRPDPESIVSSRLYVKLRP
ncbi:MAG: alpha/beta hydrolase [Planctomycetota bacterium]